MNKARKKVETHTSAGGGANGFDLACPVFEYWDFLGHSSLGRERSLLCLQTRSCAKLGFAG